MTAPLAHFQKASALASLRQKVNASGMFLSMVSHEPFTRTSSTRCEGDSLPYRRPIQQALVFENSDANQEEIQASQAWN